MDEKMPRIMKFCNAMSVKHSTWPVVVTAILWIAGCSTPYLSQQPNPSQPSQPFATTGLNGEWEVSDGSFDSTLVLDCQGKGRYSWQDGRVVTTKVQNGYWTGTWYQKGNDREGGFEVLLSNDRTKAEGRWWYSRIGSEHLNPGERGGPFSMSRPTPTSQPGVASCTYPQGALNPSNSSPSQE